MQETLLVMGNPWVEENQNTTWPISKLTIIRKRTKITHKFQSTFNEGNEGIDVSPASTATNRAFFSEIDHFNGML